MDAIKSLLAASPLIALFLCVALGYAIGKVRIGQCQVGGVVGTLFAAIVIGQIGIEVDSTVKTLGFALFIYSLGYVCGPQFFSSLGRATLDQVHLSIFNSVLVFVLIWGLAQLAGLDKGTAAGLLAGATTESASVGTAGEALRSLGLESAEVATLEANIGVSYAVTYLFGFTFVVFYVSTIAPWLLRIDLKEAAKAYQERMGSADDEFEPGQEEAIFDIVVRAYEVTDEDVANMTVAQFEAQYAGDIVIEQVVRGEELLDVTADVVLKAGDRVALIGRRKQIAVAGKALVRETADLGGLGFVSETREAALTNPRLVGARLREAKSLVAAERRRGVYITGLTRAGHRLDLNPWMRLQAGDVIELYGPARQIETAAKEIGYSIVQTEQTDYIYLGFGIIAGILIGMYEFTVAGSPVSLGTGGGCLVSGLVFGWLRSKHPRFGSLPTATALHLRDFGLAVFVANVGLAVGPQAMTLLAEKGFLLPVLSLVVVLVPITISLYYARYVLKMDPVVTCGALAGVFTCTAGLNAVIDAAGSKVPLLGYTVPYALANVFLTLLGPVIVLTV